MGDSGKIAKYVSEAEIQIQFDPKSELFPLTDPPPWKI